MREISGRLEAENHALLEELEVCPPFPFLPFFSFRRLNQHPSFPFQKANETRIELLTSLSHTLSSLSQTHVPPSIHQLPPCPSSIASSSIFGENLDRSLSPPTETEQTGDHHPKERWKTLRDFVDDDGLDRLVDELDWEQEAIETEMESLLALPASLMPPSSWTVQWDEAGVKDSVVDQTIKSVLAERTLIIDAIQQEMDGLARHWDQVSHAMKLSEIDGEVEGSSEQGLSGVDEEELEGILVSLLFAFGFVIDRRLCVCMRTNKTPVLIEDTAHLPHILEDVEGMLQAMIHLQ